MWEVQCKVCGAGLVQAAVYVAWAWEGKRMEQLQQQPQGRLLRKQRMQRKAVCRGVCMCGMECLGHSPMLGWAVSEGTRFNNAAQASMGSLRAGGWPLQLRLYRSVAAQSHGGLAQEGQGNSGARR